MSSSTRPEQPLTVVRLRIYPVKGTRGLDVDRMAFDEVGPRYDRRWMVVDADGRFLSQREEPSLATIAPSLSDGVLTLQAPGTTPLEVSSAPGPAQAVSIWNSTVEATTTGDAAEAWISAFLGRPSRLVHLPNTSVRETNPRFAQGRRVSFADGYPVLVVTSASVEEVGRRAGRAIPEERFRPNIVVGGARPHGEDRWRRVRMGNLDFTGAKLCARCTVTTVNQEDGSRDPDSEPLRSLALYRKIENAVFFGLNAVHEGEGTVRVGDSVHVTERGVVPAF